MPRNSSGTYTLPAGNPVVPNTLIETTWANPTMSDLGSAITDSLDRNGRGAMLAALKLTDGTVAAPALSFSAESTTGVYRAAANTLAFAVAGVLAMSMNATTITLAKAASLSSTFAVTGASTFTGAATFNGGVSIPGGITGVLAFSLGAVGAPSITFTGDLNTGMWSSGADAIDWAVGGAQALRLTTTALINSLAQISNPLGAAGAPSYSFTGDLNTGMWSPGADAIAWSVNGAEVLRLNASALRSVEGVVVGASIPTTFGFDFVTDKNWSNIHGHYGFIDKSVASFTVPPAIVYGHASFASAIEISGNQPIDHHNDFQAYATYNGSGLVDAWHPFYALPTQNGPGTVTKLQNFVCSNPLGAGPITDLYGLYVENLTRGAENWGFYIEGSAVKNLMVGPLLLGTEGFTAEIKTNSGTGNLDITPRAGFHTIIQAGNVGIGMAPLATPRLTVAGGIDARHAAAVDATINVSTSGVQNTVFGFNNSGATNANGVPNNTAYFGNLNAYGVLFLAGGSPFLGLTSDGRLYGVALHNNAGAVTGTTNQYIASGTYTPTLTNVTNVAGSTAFAGQWVRVGNVVTVSLVIQIDPTAAASSELGVSLPIASALATFNQLGGTATRVDPTSAPLTAAIQADFTNDRAQLLWINDGVLANAGWSVYFQYVIL